MGYSVKTLTSVVLLTGLFLTNHAMGMWRDPYDDEFANIAQSRTQMNYGDLITVGKRFISFLKKVGQSNKSVTPGEISELFDPLCKKIVNGKDLGFQSLEDHAKQLAIACEAAGNWNIIETLLLSASSEDRTCSLQFSWDAEKLGKHTTMAILYLNDEGKKISEIHEVFSPLQQEHVLFK